MKVSSKPFVIIDTREQSPYIFPEWPSMKKGLKTGDYTIMGHESSFVIERKSQTDLLGCIFEDRFKAELKRLSEFKMATLIIEGNLTTLANDRFYKGNIKSVVGMLQSIQLLYGVHVLYLDNRDFAQRYAAGLIEKYYRYSLNKKEQ